MLKSKNNKLKSQILQHKLVNISCDQRSELHFHRQKINMNMNLHRIL